MAEILASIVEDRRKEIIEHMEKGGPDGDFTDAEGRLRLGHLHVLKHVLSSNYSSALILEDDADWDVAIREQTPAIANAIRDLTDGVVGPWGFNWDYLALGHCGAGAVKNDTSRVIYDPTTAPAKDHKALWGSGKELQNNTRFVHRTTGTVCTFGYAVSRHGAKKLIDHLSGSGQPLDIDYAGFCNGGGLNCYAVAPEIIHHHRWTGKKITSGGAMHGALEPGETEQKFTVNIKYSARCNSDPDIVKDRASGTQKELIQCLPTGMSKDKYSTK
ncbi:hypothetical protein MMC07_008378 [Pseudocyphellaria aurata]|nr:hypothetical protein [Pseudocyphellaria aurata]